MRLECVAAVEPIADSPSMEMQAAALTLGDAITQEVSSEHQLQEALAGLSRLREGQLAVLERGPADYIEARCHGELWSVLVRRKRMLTACPFTAAMTSEYSERRVRERRALRSVVDTLKWMLRAPPPEQAIGVVQVKTLFAEYLSEKKFSIPLSGA